MPFSIRQGSFAGGEIAPPLYGRSDLARYDISVKTCRNWLVTPHGALMNRPGTKYSGVVKDSTLGTVRLIPFLFTRDQAFVLEFGDGYVRVWKDGAQITSEGTPIEVAVPYGESDLRRIKYAQIGDIITLTHPSYPPAELRRLAADGSEWEYEVLADQNIVEQISVWSPSESYVVGDRVTKIYRGLLSDTWYVYECKQANTDQAPYIADPPFASAYWTDITDKVTVFDLQFSSATVAQTDTTSDGARPPKRWQWAITAVWPDGTESLPSLILDPPVDNSATDTTKDGAILLYTDRPVQLSWKHVRGVSTYRVYRGRNGVFGIVAEVDPASVTTTASTGVQYCEYRDDAQTVDFSQQPPKKKFPFGWKRWRANCYYDVGDRIVSNGNIYECVEAGTSGLGGGVSGTDTYISDPSNVTTWQRGHAYAAGARVQSNGYSYICVYAHTSASSPDKGPWGATTWAALNHAWDTQILGTWHRTWEYVGRGGAAGWKYVRPVSDVPGTWSPYPAVTGYYEQRRIYANTDDHPSGIWGTRTADYWNFDSNLIVQSSDSLQFDLAAQRYEEVRGFSILRVLGTLTSQGQWAVMGDLNGGPLSPSNIYAKPQLVYPSSWLDPLQIGNTALYVQDQMNVIRDLTFQLATDGYQSQDMTVFSSHLFWSHTIKAWAYQQTPFSVVWAVREDGVLLGCTYVRDQDVVAWHRHDTQGGVVEDVCCVPEGAEDAVYMIVNRDGTRMVERLMPRIIPRLDDGTWNTIDGLFLDCASMQLFDSPTSYVTGLDWLEGQSVMALAGGAVAGPYTVVGGAIDISTEFPDGVMTIHVGLPITSDIEQLPLKIPGGDVKRANAKSVFRADIEVADTRGAILVGNDFVNMREWRQREVKDSYGNVPPFTGVDKIRLPSTYRIDGTLCLRHTDPLPVTLLALGREVDLGGV